MNIAIIVNRLGDHWLGGVNYYRNLISVFDAAAERDIRLHLLTDDAGFLDGLEFSSRVIVHQLSMLQRRSAAWAVRQSLHLATGRDVQLLAKLKQLDVNAVFFKYVAGSREAGIPSFPWIPDFQSQHHPELFTPDLVRLERKYAATYVSRADGLIVSSQTARDDAVKLFGARRDRVHVLRFAPKIDFGPLQSTALRDEIFQRYRLTRPYLFLPNQYWKHKNHRLVVDAMIRLRQAGSGVPLVVSTGKQEDPRDPAYFGEFDALVRDNGLSAQYRMLGVIPRQDMMVLMAHAAAVVNPSRFEGWSTTVEEAKALGKRLLVSDIAVHREQVAGLAGARTFPTDDAAALAALLRDLHEQHGHAAADACPPRPDAALYASFTQQFLGMIRRLSIAHDVAT